MRWIATCPLRSLRANSGTRSTNRRHRTRLVNRLPQTFLSESSLQDHVCRRSGDCCIIHWGSFEATHDDIMRWRSQRRDDILRHISIDSTDASNQRGIFVPKSCPFLGRDKQGLYMCKIHETKPFYCRAYPDDGICEHHDGADV